MPSDPIAPVDPQVELVSEMAKLIEGKNLPTDADAIRVRDLRTKMLHRAAIEQDAQRRLLLLLGNLVMRLTPDAWDEELQGISDLLDLIERQAVADAVETCR